MIDIYLITDKMTQFHIIHYLNELYIICSKFYFITYMVIWFLATGGGGYFRGVSTRSEISSEVKIAIGAHAVLGRTIVPKLSANEQVSK